PMFACRWKSALSVGRPFAPVRNERTVSATIATTDFGPFRSDDRVGAVREGAGVSLAEIGQHQADGPYRPPMPWAPPKPIPVTIPPWTSKPSVATGGGPGAWTT